MPEQEERIKDGYDASKIQVLGGLDAVRKRPSMYIGSTGLDGLHHLVYEVVDNSIDEALAGYCNRILVIIHKDCSVTVADNGRGIPVDVMPKFNKSALEIVMTKLHAGGKFDKQAYKVSGGLHGVGVSVVNALSKKLRVEVRRDSKIYCQEYGKGEPISEVKVVGESNATGTVVTFFPDDEILDTVDFQFDVLASRMRELAFLNPGLDIKIKDERSGKEHVFKFDGGIRSFVDYINNNKKALHEVIYINSEKDGVVVELAMQYNDGYLENIFSFVNNINTVEGGTHLSGFKTALTRSINSYGEKNKLIGDIKISSEDSREGLSAVISIKVPEPQFEGQTKAKLGNSDVKGIVDSVVSSALGFYFDEHPDIVRIVIGKCVTAAKAREAARKARELTRRKSVFDSGSLPGKLADCSNTNPDVCELFIVEGDSAGGCFSGDTEVALVDGRNLSFKELVEEDKKGKKNYCYTIKKDGTIGIGLILNPRKTKKNAEVIKVVLDNNQEIVCTPNHKFMLRDGGYSEAKSLRDGMSLMPLNRKLSKVEGRNYNHKIKEIVKLERRVDVYDLEVEGTHNFALASGVFVHNSAKQGRSREFQAVLPLRGKILNVEKARLDKIFSNNEIVIMISAIGTGINEEFNAGKLRYHKVIIATDADVDGAHIRTLLLTFFFRYMRQLIEQGRIFIAQPPLYKVSKNKKSYYIYNDEKLRALLKEIGDDNLVIQRYKGLGEMNPEQLWSTTMNPENRSLLRVTVEDAIEADKLFTILMGSEVEPRRAFIEKHAKEVVNLDV